MTQKSDSTRDVGPSPLIKLNSMNEQIHKDVEKVSPRATNEKHKDKDKSDPFGDESHAEVKYRTMEWWQAGMVMIAETVSLGILSLPSVLATVGIVPGMILIGGLGIIATYTGYVLGQFKLAYPHVHSMADAGEVMLGPVGREVFGFAQITFLIFCMGGHVLTFAIVLDVVTRHGICSIVFGLVGFVLCAFCTMPRTLLKLSHLSVISFISIVSAVLVTMVGLGIHRPGEGVVTMTAKTSFYKGLLAVTNIIYAYAGKSTLYIVLRSQDITSYIGHVGFFSFISELRTPSSYPKALFLLQGVDTSMYLIVAIVIYYYAGPDVASPALGSTSVLLRKVAYGTAIPTIVLSGVINGHVAAKYVYVRLFRGTDRMSKRTWLSFGAWALIVLTLWILAWVIAEVIPVFNNLLGLMSALFASWFTYGLSGVFWLWLNRGRYLESKKKVLLSIINISIFGMGATIVIPLPSRID